MPEYVWLIAGVIFGVVGILSFRVRFDVNEWLRDRHVRRHEQYKMLCPHAVLVVDRSGNPRVDSFFISLMETLSLQCSRCGLITNDEGIVDRQLQYWTRHPKKLSAREKEFQDLMKKLGYL